MIMFISVHKNSIQASENEKYTRTKSHSLVHL